MGAQVEAFGQALTWLFGELIDQRAEEPVAFLAQLGRDHRKYGVTQSHYYSMHEALYTTLRSQLIENWDDKLDDTARAARGAVHRGDARRGRRRAGSAVLRRHRRRAQSGCPATSRWSGCNWTSRWPTTPASTSPSRCRSGRAAGAISARPSPPIPAAASSSTSARSLAEWSARRSSAKPGPATGGGCPTRTAACRSTGTPATC